MKGRKSERIGEKDRHAVVVIEKEVSVLLDEYE